MTAAIRVCSAGLQCRAAQRASLSERFRSWWGGGGGEGRREKTLLPLITSFSLPPSLFASPSPPPSFHCKWVWSLSDVIQLISLGFNYKCKHPSYPSPLDGGSTFSNKLPLLRQESLNYHFYSRFPPCSSLWFAPFLRSAPFFTSFQFSALGSVSVRPVESHNKIQIYFHIIFSNLFSSVEKMFYFFIYIYVCNATNDHWFELDANMNKKTTQSLK